MNSTVSAQATGMSAVRTGRSPDAQGRTKAASSDLMLEALPPRLRDIAMMRGLGFKLHEIARHFDISPQAVSLVLSRHRRRIEGLGLRTEQWDLSTRAVTALARLGITTRAQARSLDIAALLRGKRNCGEKTIKEIQTWLASDGDASGEEPPG